MVLAVLVVPSVAAASKQLQVGVSDPAITDGDPAVLTAFAPRWRDAGVDVAMVTADWRAIAPDAEKDTPPVGFDDSDPQSPLYNWERLDHTIKTLTRNRIEPIVTVTGPGPLWGSSDPEHGSARYRPDPALFAHFATAVARRYGTDVNRYIIWYEPNSPANLRPQYSCVRKKCAERSPSIYREIFADAAPAIRASDSGAAVYAGALAGRGSNPTDSDSQMKPLIWLRSFGCLADNNKADRTSAKCVDFTPAEVDGFAYHPDQRAQSPSSHLKSWAEAGIGDTIRITHILDFLQETGGLINNEKESSPISLFYTEFGYQTNPPDVFSGVGLGTQATWLQQSARLAFNQARVKLLGQYIWRDHAIHDNGQGTDAYDGSQSGLYMFDGSEKPSARAFLNPFWASRSSDGRSARLWGQVRPGAAHEVVLERRVGSGSYRRLSSVTTDVNGYFEVSASLKATATYRFYWVGRVGKASSRRHLSDSMTLKRR